MGILEGIYERKIYPTPLDYSVDPERTDFIAIHKYMAWVLARLVVPSADTDTKFYSRKIAKELRIPFTDCFVDKSIKVSLEDIELEDIVPCPDKKGQTIEWVADLDTLEEVLV